MGLNHKLVGRQNELSLNDASIPVDTTGKLYNNGGILYWEDIRLSELKTFNYSASRNSINTTNSYLQANDIFTNLTPFILPVSCKLIYITASTSNNQTWIAEVRKSGIVIANLIITSAASNYDIYSIDFNAGDNIQFYCNGTDIDKPLITAYFLEN